MDLLNEIVYRKPMTGNFIHKTYGEDMLDQFKYYLTNEYRKENETMKTDMDIRFETERNAIQEEYALKISELEAERDIKLAELRKDLEHAKIIEAQDEAAFRQKAKYDALVKAGFTKQQAMDMVMKDLENK